MKMGLETKRRHSKLSDNMVNCAWMPAEVQTNHGRSSAHAQWFSHQNDRADYRDIMR